MDDTVITLNQQTSHTSVPGKSTSTKTAVNKASKTTARKSSKSAASVSKTTSKANSSAESTTKKPRAKKATSEKKVAIQSTNVKQSITPITEQQRYEMIERTAYLIAEKRGFVDGDPTDDWIQAETQIDNYLMSIK